MNDLSISALADAPGVTATGYLLQTPDGLQALGREAVDLARRLGAERAAASVTERAGLTMKISNGVLDVAVRDGAQGLTVRALKNGRLGVASSSALSPHAVRQTVAQAVTIAGQVDEDDDLAFPEPEWLFQRDAQLPLFAPSGLGPRDLAEIAFDIEASALAVPGEAAGRRVMEAGATSHDTISALVIDEGFAHASLSSRQSRWCVALAEHEGAMTRAWWTAVDRRVQDQLSTTQVGARAMTRTLQKRGARRVATQSCPVVLDARVATTVLQDLVAALSGRAQHLGSTWLPHALGVMIMPERFFLTEDPFVPYGMASGLFDNEGVAAQIRSVVAAGVVEGLFLTSLHARKLGLPPTGNANGAWNLSLTSSEPNSTLKSLFRQMGTGLWVTEFLGGGVNPVTGAFTKAVVGFWIEGGEIAFPVHDLTIATDLPRLFRGILALGDDIHRNDAITTGSLLIDDMRIASR